ncbi:hypothetical protein V8E36_007000 [Tilletia maclaganii]
MPHSHHSHSGSYCSHAQSALEHVVARAATLGFSTYGLSEHVPRALPSELYPEEVEAALTPTQLASRFHAYLQHARQLQSEYSSNNNHMQILVGCETENTDGEGEHLHYFIHTILRTPPSTTNHPAQIGTGTLDYIVGSVHHVHSIPIDFDLPHFNHALNRFGPHEEDRHAALMIAYLDAQLLLLHRLQPEIIGHFDLCRLYHPTASMRPGPDTSPDSILHTLWANVERNVRYAASYGALFELNASSFRKGWSTSYPGQEVLELILSLGGRVCFSDDSHGTHQVGLNYHRLRDYLASPALGSTPPSVWYLRRVEPSTPPVGAPDESARLARENASRPGDDAPTRFPRGTEAVQLTYPEWSAWPGWDRIAAEQQQQQQAST